MNFIKTRLRVIKQRGFSYKPVIVLSVIFFPFNLFAIESPYEENDSSRMDGSMQILHHRADEENDTKSQNILGGLYLSGIGEEKPNEEKSLKYYLMAAENGDVDSMILVSSLYQARKNYNKAIKWSKEALFNGDTKAALLIGTQYFAKAKSTEKEKDDLTLAFVWTKASQILGEKIPAGIDEEMNKYFKGEEIKLINQEASLKASAVKQQLKQRSMKNDQ